MQSLFEAILADRQRVYRIVTCTLFLIFNFIYAFGQPEKELSSKNLLKDFESLMELIEAHPDPYTHISEEDFKEKAEEIKSALDEPQTLLDFYKKTASIVALLKDGHSSVHLPASWLTGRRKELGAFPYELYLTNENELYLIKEFSKGDIPLGSKILSINGISTDSFLRVVDPFISYEKENFRNTKIDGNFEHYLYVAFGRSDSTRLEYFDTDTSVATVTNMPYKEWKNLQKEDREEREMKIAMGEPYAYEKLSNGIAILKIYAFLVSDFESYELFLHRTFKSIHKDSIHSLIIDIRGNFGGWPKIESSLFHYISDSYFKTLARSTTKVSMAYQKNINRNIPALKGGLPYIRKTRHFIDIDAILGYPAGTFLDEEAFFNEEAIDKQYEFKGNSYLLTNRDSYSAASSFASTFQCYQMGVIIGEETGGTKIFRANAMQETLSKSHLVVYMSTSKLHTTCYDKEFEGVKPTIEYSPSVLDLLSNMDTQLFFALRMIKKIQEKNKP